MFFNRSIRLQAKHGAPQPARFYAEGEEPPPPDDYRTALLKFIPSEIIAAYTLAIGTVATLTTDPKQHALMIVLQWIAFGVSLVLCFFYLKRVGKVASTLQVLLSCVAFATWAYTIGSPFTDLPHYHPAIGVLPSVFIPVCYLIFLAPRQ